MKNTGLKKMAAIVLAAAMCLALPGIGAMAVAPNAAEGGIAAPANIIITATDNCLTNLGGYILECYGGTEVPYRYEAYVKVELQQLNGGWTTIKSWSDRGGSYATICQNYAVESSYDYRLKLTHKAYDSNGNLIETITKYSNIV